MIHDTIKVAEKMIDGQSTDMVANVGTVDVLTNEVAIDGSLRLANLLRDEVKFDEIVETCGVLATRGSWADIPAMTFGQFANERKKTQYTLSAARVISTASKDSLAGALTFHRLLGAIKDDRNDAQSATAVLELTETLDDSGHLFGEPYAANLPSKIAKRIQKGLSALNLVSDQHKIAEAKFHHARRAIRRLANTHVLAIASHSAPVTAEAVVLRRIVKRMGYEHGTAVYGDGEKYVYPSDELKALIDQLS